MKTRTTNWLFIISLVIGFVIGFGFTSLAIYGGYCLVNLPEPCIAEVIPMDAWQLQSFLAKKGYYEDDIEGIVGPNTIRAWEQWTCDEQARRWDVLYETDR